MYKINLSENQEKNIEKNMDLPALVDRAGALVVAVEASAAQLGVDIERQHELIQSEALRKRVSEQVDIDLQSSPPLKYTQ